jgi:hypothetical protein
MSRRHKKDDNWTIESVKVLRSERVDENNRIDLRIVKWEKAEKPTLEKRRIWEREDGDRPTKIVGLTVDDVKYIRENYADIINNF